VSAEIRLTDDQYHILQSTDGAVTVNVGDRTVALHGPHASPVARVLLDAACDRVISLDEREIAVIAADRRGLSLDDGETIRWEAGA
jgi:hypothetical protein